MSDDVFSVTTPFADVAELAQGYLQRADGERLWLPLVRELPADEAVRFVVHLADGTPAFAGAGRCLQSADQGDAAGEHRYETLLDSLQFDERSQPVYDYIVAVRQAAGLEGTVGGPAEERDDPTEEFDLVDDEFGDAEATEYLGRPEAAEGVAGLAAPEPMPTGMLRRPAIATHWQPAPPRAPEPSPQSGLFQYNGGGLPAPERPPWPDIDASLFVRPAPRPVRQVAAHDAADAGGFGDEPNTADVEYDDAEALEVASADEFSTEADEFSAEIAVSEPPDAAMQPSDSSADTDDEASDDTDYGEAGGEFEDADFGEAAEADPSDEAAETGEESESDPDEEQFD